MAVFCRFLYRYFGRKWYGNPKRQIRVHDALPRINCKLWERSSGADPHNVDQDIQSTKGPFRLSDDSLRRIWNADIGHEQVRIPADCLDCLKRMAPAAFVEVDDHDPRAVGREAQAHRSPHAGLLACETGTGDYTAPSVQPT